VNHKPTDIHLAGTELYFLLVQTRVPLKFGTETLDEVTCARVRVWVVNDRGDKAEGWGETPLSVQWVWPSPLPYAERLRRLQAFCVLLAAEFARFEVSGHPLEVGMAFQERMLPLLLRQVNQQRPPEAAMPWLAALVCLSAFDLALHDAYGQLLQRPVFTTFNAEFMQHDLGDFLEPANTTVSFAGKFPQDFFLPQRRGGLEPRMPRTDDDNRLQHRHLLPPS